MEFKRKYFENCIICGYCNGDGCRGCDYHGITSREQFIRDRNEEGDPIEVSIRYSAALLCMVNPLKFYGV